MLLCNLTNKKGLYLFFVGNMIRSISINAIVFTVIWLNIADSVLDAGIGYMAYQVFESYSMLFISRVGDKLGRKVALGYSTVVSFACSVLALSLYVVDNRELIVFLSVFICLLLGLCQSLASACSTPLIHDRYGNRSKVVLRLGNIFQAYRIFLAPIIGVVATVSFGGLATTFACIFLSAFSVYLFYLSTTKFPNLKNEDSAESINMCSIIRVLLIPTEKIFIPTLLIINFCLVPFFMVTLPYLASNGFFSDAKVIAYYDISFGLGMMISSKYVIKWAAPRFSDYTAILAGLVCMLVMMSLGISNYMAFSLLSFFIGGMGMSLVVVNISNIRVMSIPKSNKSSAMSILVFWSVALNPFSVLFLSKMHDVFSDFNYVAFYTTLCAASVAYYAIMCVFFINGRKVDLNSIYSEALK